MDWFKTMYLVVIVICFVSCFGASWANKERIAIKDVIWYLIFSLLPVVNVVMAIVASLTIVVCLGGDRKIEDWLNMTVADFEK